MLRAALAMLVCGWPLDFLPTLNLPSSAVTFTTKLPRCSEQGPSEGAGRGVRAFCRRCMSRKGAAALACSVSSNSSRDTSPRRRDQLLIPAMSRGCPDSSSTSQSASKEGSSGAVGLSSSFFSVRVRASRRRALCVRRGRACWSLLRILRSQGAGRVRVWAALLMSTWMRPGWERSSWSQKASTCSGSLSSNCNKLSLLLQASKSSSSAYLLAASAGQRDVASTVAPARSSFRHTW
mmetsp:Transcript_16250/g.23686  ORF Transcript_16250/g.23686 Transcript_16250/m.23686 type:complete len:236 (-) Transcript_16250:804-1511(-)